MCRSLRSTFRPTTKKSQHLARVAHPLRHPLPVKVLQQRNSDLSRQAEELFELADVNRFSATRRHLLASSGEVVVMHVDAVGEPNECSLVHEKSDDALDDFRFLSNSVDQFRYGRRLQAGI